MDHAAAAEFPPVAQLDCPHAPTCPGCPLIALDYAAQLVHKERAVRAAFAAYPELAGVRSEPTTPAAQVQDYRTRAKLVADAAALGLFARGTHRVIDLPECRVLDPLLASAFAALRRLLQAAPGLIDGADVARAGPALLVTLIAPPHSSQAALHALAAALHRELPAGSSVALARRGADAVQLLSAPAPALFGAGELRVQAAPDAPYHYAAHGAFMQAHAQTSSAIRARIVARLAAVARASARDPLLHSSASARAQASPAELRGLRVLELHAGSGVLALALAARGAQVTAVESFAPACERLERAAREQGLPLRVLNGDAAAQVKKLAAVGERFAALLFNPPRRGLEPALRAYAAALDPALIGYVSCRPSSLARDLAHFARLGYGCLTATPLDMMPQTDQVETLAWLARAPAPPPELIARDDVSLVVDKPGLEPMEGLLTRLASIDGCQGALPISMLHAASSGLVLLARDAARREAAAAAATQWSFTALVKGIARSRGALPGAGGARPRYTRLAVVAGHSLLRVVVAVHGPAREQNVDARGSAREPSVDARGSAREQNQDTQLLHAFARIGLPVLGDPRDRASARHFALRHGLERPFLHATELTLAGRTLRAPLAPDLAAVLDSLGASALAQTV